MTRISTREPPDAPEIEGAEAPQKDKTGVQSLQRAFAILEAIAQGPEGLSLGELARRVNLHNSTTFHLVKTMVALGYARQAPETKRYHIGRMLFTVASGALNEVELVGLATPLLEKLAEATGETAHLAIRLSDELAVIARAAGRGAFQLVDRAGGLRPLHATALGKALLATLAPEKFEHFLGSVRLESFTPKTITETSDLRAEVERIREEGIAYDDSEYIAEVRCVAGPVYDFTGRATGALGISGPVWRLSLQKLSELSNGVAETARELSKILGARPITKARKD
jgi:DNA-binding IclR family transcriptional regulator